MASQRGAANPKFIDSCVVGVKVYGSRPSTFNEIKNSIREVKRAAHLWPPFFRGIRSW